MPCKVLAVQLGTAVLSHIHPASCSAVRLSPLSNHCRIELPRQQRRCASIVRASTQVSLRAFTKNRSVCTYLWQCTSTLQGSTPDSWVAANAERLRSLPLVAGASGIIGVLLNRLLSGVSCHNLLDALDCNSGKACSSLCPQANICTGCAGCSCS